MQPVSFEDIRAAEPVVHRWLPRTPLYEYPGLSRLLGCRLWLKHENHLPVGAFKVRGGVNLVASLSTDERERGVIGVSTGNHGQSLAWASRQLGARCWIVAPRGCNPDKAAAMREWGATLIEHGADFDEAKTYCENLIAGDALPLEETVPFEGAWQPGRLPRYVHSANEPKLIAGVGTYALEIFDAISAPDVILAPVGLGSGICGTALVAERLAPGTRVIGVQAEGAPAVTDSWRSGRIVSHPKMSTRAEGLATRAAASMTLDIMRRLVHDMVLVSDAEIEAAIRLLLAATHNLPEGAGAATTAAAFKFRQQLAGKTVVAVLSGGNLDLRTLPAILAAGE